MTNGWEPGGPLIDVLVELSSAVKLGPQPGDPADMASYRALTAWLGVRKAYRLLDAARQKAIEEESEMNCLGHGHPIYAAPLEPPDPPRDYFEEAIRIAAGDNSFSAEERHVVAVVHKLRELGIVVRGIRRMLQDSDVSAILTAAENAVPFDYRAVAIANARAQAAGVANPVTREQLGECLDAAERAKR